MEIGHGQWVAEYNDNGVDANRAQAQVAIKKGTELTIRYTHMLQVQIRTIHYRYKCLSLQLCQCLNVDRVT